MGIVAIVLSGGKSERMGSPKALLAFRGKTFLAHIVDSIRAAGMEQVQVIVGHHRAEIAEAFPELSLVFNPDYEKGMGTSVQAGVRALPPDTTGVGIFLVDHPSVGPRVIAALAAELQPGRIVVPSYEGKRGHPVFIGADLLKEILDLGPDRGLNTVVRRDAGRVIEVPVNDAGVVLDIDTPELFEKLLRENE